MNALVQLITYAGIGAFFHAVFYSPTFVFDSAWTYGWVFGWPMALLYTFVTWAGMAILWGFGILLIVGFFLYITDCFGLTRRSRY